MSRAFLNEDKFEQAGDELVERPLSPHPNYVTPRGLRLLQEEATRLESLRQDLASNTDDSFAAQKKAEEQLYRAGAHYVIDGIWDLPDVVEEINDRLLEGDSPT